MTILTYKYRVKDRAACKALRLHSSAVNQVWNWCVAQQRDSDARYRAGAPKRKWLAYFELARACAGVGKMIGLRQQTVQSVCRQFSVSRDKVRRAPAFRASGGSRRALGWLPFQQQSRRIEGASVIYRGKRYRFWEGKRPVPESAKGGCFVEDARGRWYVCFHVEVEDNRETGVGQVGVDLGLKQLATCSDGVIIAHPAFFRHYERKLATAQRAGNKARARALNARIANARRDYLHKIAARLARANELIVVGDVSAAKVAKTRAGKSALDAGWSMLRNMLAYKARMHRARFDIVDERMTSQTCSSCGALPPERPRGIAGLGIREWTCGACGAVHDRDVNAARNILALGVQRRGDGSRMAV